MDFSKFSDDDFNVKEWINNVFRSHSDEQQREAYTATLVTKLQRFIQEVNKSLEEVSQQTVSNLPRVLRDVETLKQESLFLWQQMQQVKNEIQAVEEKTSHSMQVLVAVDKVKTRVEQTCSALKEADNWSSLAAAIEDIFRSGDSKAVADQLQSMKTSLQVLKNSPDYDDKVLHLEALKNRLEASVSPAVVVACIQHDTEKAKQFHTIFKNVERVPELINYYLKCHRGRIANRWQDVVNGSSEAAKVAALNPCCDLLLNEFYELLLNACTSETNWCSMVFGKEESTRIVIQLLLEVILSVDNGPAALISTSMSNLESDKLFNLISLHGITKKFTTDLEMCLKITSQKPEVNELLYKLSESLWLPYVPYLLKYSDLELETLLTHLSSVNITSGDLIDLVQELDDSVKKVFDEATNAIGRCDKLTAFCGTSGLVWSIEKYLVEFCDRFSRQLRTIAISCGLTPNSKKHDHDDEDWTTFQHCVSIIATCGRLLLQVNSFEGLLVASLTPFSRKRHRLESSTANQQSLSSLPWQNYDYLKLAELESRDQLFATLNTVHEFGVDTTASLLPVAKQRIAELNQQTQKLTFDAAFAYVKRKLSSAILQADSGDDDAIVAELPRCSVSPSESATRIGQYLMTLPQHLESFSADDSATSDKSLQVALLAGHLPFAPDPDLDNMSDKWLSSVVQATEHTYVEAVTHIDKLLPSAARQLVADFDYMINVIESLGMTASEQLVNLRDLLDAENEEEFKERSKQVSRRLIDVIGQMRNIKI